jgi:hypothetical protein
VADPIFLQNVGVRYWVHALIRRVHAATRTTPCKQCRIEGKQSMNYLQYAFYAINIHLEKVVGIFVGEMPVRTNLATRPRARANLLVSATTGSANTTHKSYANLKSSQLLYKSQIRALEWMPKHISRRLHSFASHYGP